MQSPRTRIAYLKRMLRRLEQEQARFEKLRREGQLTQAEAEFGREMWEKERQETMEELQRLEANKGRR